jgi:hypothetical protein
MDNEILPIWRDLDGTMGPESLYFGQPTVELASKESVVRISELVGEAAGGEERDLSRVVVQRPSSPN